MTTELMLNPENPEERRMMIVEREFALTQRKAQVFAQSKIVPEIYQNNVANCIIAMEMAERLHTGVMEIMQNLYVVHGNPAFSSKYLIAMINMSSILEGRLKFIMVGTKGEDDYGCYAQGTEAATGDQLIGTTVTIDLAKKEGWYGKKMSKWPTMTDQMLQYRAAAFWSRVNAPEATMGMMTTEEQQDIQEIDITPQQAQIGSVGEMVAAKQAKEEVLQTVVAAIEPVEKNIDPIVWPQIINNVWTDSTGAQFDEGFIWVEGAPHPAVSGKGVFKKIPKKAATKAQPAQDTNQPQQTVNEILTKQISVAETDEDFAAILKQNAWSKLEPGQAQELQILIEDRKMDLAMDY